MRITHNLAIDLQNKGNLKKIDVVQGDTYTRSVSIKLYDNGILWDIPQESTILVRYSKPDGTAGIYEQLPDGTIAGYVEDNTVTVLLAPQMFTCPGRVPTQVSLVVDDQILSTFSFVVDVEADPSKGAAGSESYFDWKTAFIPQVSNAHVGHYLEIESVDSNGRIWSVKDVPNPAIAAELMALDAKNIALSAEATADSAYANAEMAKELAASAIPQTSGANVGQYLEITAVDSNGRVAGIKGVPNPAITAELKAQEAKRTALEAEATANSAYAKAEVAIQHAAIANESATSAMEKADEALETANYAQNTSERNADSIADLARTKLPQVTGAKVGQYIMVTGVDDEGRIAAFAPVDAPTSGSIDGDLDMKGDSINGVGSLSFNGPDSNVGDGFWIQANYAISKEDGSKTSVVQLFSNDTDDPVVIRNVSPAQNDNDVVNLAQLNSAVSGKLDAPATAKVGQAFVVKAVDENGKPTECEAADLPANGGGFINNLRLVAHITIDPENPPTSIIIDQDTSGNSIELRRVLIYSDVSSKVSYTSFVINGAAWDYSLDFNHGTGWTYAEFGDSIMMSRTSVSQGAHIPGYPTLRAGAVASAAYFGPAKKIEICSQYPYDKGTFVYLFEVLD